MAKTDVVEHQIEVPAIVVLKKLSAREWAKQTGEMATELHAEIGAENYNMVMQLMDEFGEASIEAAAAPELLEALRKAHETIHLMHGDIAWEIYNECSPEMKQINAAITKATSA